MALKKKASKAIKKPSKPAKKSKPVKAVNSKTSKPSKNKSVGVGKLPKGMVKSADAVYRSLYSKAYRKKVKIQELNKGKKRGYKNKRTEAYKELVVINREIVKYCKKRAYTLPASLKTRRNRLKIAKRGYKKRNYKKKIIQYSAKVWDFEAQFSNIIKSKKFKTIIIVNVKKTFNRKSAPSTILYWYDIARDSAYNEFGATTPYVEVTEDYNSMTITIEIVS